MNADKAVDIADSSGSSVPFSSHNYLTLLFVDYSYSILYSPWINYAEGLIFVFFIATITFCLLMYSYGYFSFCMIIHTIFEQEDVFEKSKNNWRTLEI